MGRKIWDLYAPLYTKAMTFDQKSYDFIEEKIPKRIENQMVLELATGPGIIAKKVAPFAKEIIATDYSPGMIAQAKKGDYPRNITFEVADATHLPYGDAFFDVVIIANALHIIPATDAVMAEIKRVLKPEGLLIAPNFVLDRKTFFKKLTYSIFKIFGVRFAHEWSTESYKKFLEEQGWNILYSAEVQARLKLVYVECMKKKGR